LTEAVNAGSESKAAKDTPDQARPACRRIDCETGKDLTAGDLEKLENTLGLVLPESFRAFSSPITADFLLFKTTPAFR